MEAWVDPGQFIFGRESAAKELKMSPSTVWNRIKKLENMRNLDIESDSKYSIITIINWNTYQGREEKGDSQVTAIGQKTDSEGDSEGDSDHPVTTTINSHGYRAGAEKGDSEGDSEGDSDRAKSGHKQEGNKEEKIKDYTAKEEKTPLLQEGKFYKTKKGKKLQGEKLSRFNNFWTAFDYRKGKAEAADVWLEIEKDLTDETYKAIIAGAKREASARPELLESDKVPKMAQGWLSGRRWEDESSQEVRRYM